MREKSMKIAICTAILLGLLVTSYALWKTLHNNAENVVESEQIWEVFCWDEELKQHSLRYVSRDKLSYEIESGMCDALYK